MRPIEIEKLRLGSADKVVLPVPDESVLDAVAFDVLAAQESLDRLASR